MIEMKKPELKKPDKAVKIETKVVKITKTEILKSSNVALTLFEKLKEAGIPIIEGFPFGRVESGTLTSIEDIENDCYIYEWKA
jgi:hypothetical protein